MTPAAQPEAKEQHSAHNRSTAALQECAGGSLIRVILPGEGRAGTSDAVAEGAGSRGWPAIDRAISTFPHRPEIHCDGKYSV
jgi:hypothetical protein